jgi:hypothetical protein
MSLFNVHDDLAAIEKGFTSLKAAFHPQVKTIQNDFHAVVNLAQTGLQTLAGVIGQSAVDAIKAGVASAETSGLSGPEKADQVRKAVENSFKASVPTLTTGLVNLGIELAVALLNTAVSGA